MNDTRHNSASHYQTGTVPRPRSHGGLVLVLLIAIVMLGGIITILGLLNIRLFVALKQEKDALKLQNTGSTTGNDPLTATQPKLSLELEDSDEDLTPQQIYASCMDSMVTIQSDSTEGTGLVLTADGYILTNCSLVKDAQELTVQLPDQQCVSAQVVGTDPLLDLAVLYVEASNLEAPVFGNSDDLKLGDPVITIGDPLGSGQEGILSHSTVSSLSGDAIGTAGIENHTGPLLDRFGQIIGFRIDPSECAIPSATLKHIAEQLVNQGYVSGRPGLGIQWEAVSELHRNYYALPAGIYVTQVDGCTSLSVGDILISLNGRSITCEEDLLTALYACKIGDSIQAEIFREDSIDTITVTVVEAKN